MPEIASVPASQPLGVGQRDTSRTSGTPAGTPTGTVDLKSLARKVLQRDSGWDTKRDTPEIKCPRPDSTVGHLSAVSAPNACDQPPAGHTAGSTPVPTQARATQPDDALAWRRTYFAECDRLMIRDGITLAQAQPRAFERVLHEWHRRHAWPGSEWCAGCGGDLAGGQSIHEFPTGESVHLTDDLACWLEFGRRWRAAAVAGLAESGIEAPEGWE